MIFDVPSATILAWLLALFFAVGAVGNWVAPGHVRSDFRRWGYPDGFHRVTAVLEALVAVLLVFGATRFWGIGLAMLIMLAAIATLLRHKEFKHALIPTTVLVLLLITAGLGS